MVGGIAIYIYIKSLGRAHKSDEWTIFLSTSASIVSPRDNRGDI